MIAGGKRCPLYGLPGKTQGDVFISPSNHDDSKLTMPQAHQRGGTDFGRDILPRLPGHHRLLAYDFAPNRVPGVRAYEERGYWRDVGTLSALAAARNDAMGSRPRFNL